jgi:peptidoglycan hydrolase CwlO-like protein
MASNNITPVQEFVSRDTTATHASHGPTYVQTLVAGLATVQHLTRQRDEKDATIAALREELSALREELTKCEEAISAQRGQLRRFIVSFD